jgi:UDP-glucose 4-epimerase
VAGEDGVIFLASSAGGLYAGSAPAPFDERTAPHPLVAYGRAKLAMEDVVHRLADATGLRAVLGRLANVYGPGQTLGKPQGLLSQLCLADATGRPLPVFVSMDTIRDYLYAGDAARMVVRSIALARDEAVGTVVTKVLASGRPVTVGYLVAEARRVFHRPLRTIPVGGSSTGQVLDLRLESRVWPEVDALAATPLAAGLARTSADVRARVVSGGPLDG